MNKQDLQSFLKTKEQEIIEYAQHLWDCPETSGKEKDSADLTRNLLREHGFTVREVPGMEHALVAEWGQGHPVVGLLAEYDALPGLSQKVASAKQAVVDRGAGHGCGHNLLGGAAFGAALAIKAYLTSSDTVGTIRFYGCPEEESLSGKVKMLPTGVFDDCDVALSWHPLTITTPLKEAFLANNSIKYRFNGVTAHAAFSPEDGRSALDAVELMNVGANYLREHIPSAARMHYTITETGGAPNIIPDKAESWYYIRAPRRMDVEDITRRLLKVAQGAGLMTETTMQGEFICGTYELLPNSVLADLTYQNMLEMAPPVYTEEELHFANQIQASLDEDTVSREANRNKELVDEGESPMFQGVVDLSKADKVSMNGSSDVGDVSWNVPTSLFVAATWPVGVPPHTWQATSASGSSLGYKGMMYAAQVMSGIAYDLYTKPDWVEKAQEEFRKRTQENQYISPLHRS